MLYEWNPKAWWNEELLDFFILFFFVLWVPCLNFLYQIRYDLEKDNSFGLPPYEITIKTLGSKSWTGWAYSSCLNPGSILLSVNKYCAARNQRGHYNSAVLIWIHIHNHPVYHKEETQWYKPMVWARLGPPSSVTKNHRQLNPVPSYWKAVCPLRNSVWKTRERKWKVCYLLLIFSD